MALELGLCRHRARALWLGLALTPAAAGAACATEANQLAGFDAGAPDVEVPDGGPSEAASNPDAGPGDAKPPPPFGDAAPDGPPSFFILVTETPGGSPQPSEWGSVLRYTSPTTTVRRSRPRPSIGRS